MTAEQPETTNARLQLLLQQADNAYRAGQMSDAEILYGDALDLLDGETDAWDTETANCLQRLGDIYRKSGRYADADRVYGRLVAVGEKVFGVNHPHMAAIRATQAEIKDKTKSKSNSNGGEENQDLFGFGKAERRALAKPQAMGKLRNHGPMQETSGPRKVSPLPLGIIAAGALVGVACLCIPANTAGSLGLAGDWLKTNKSFAGAHNCYELAIRINPKSADLAYKLGSLELAEHHFDKAIASLSQAIAIDPNLSQAYLERGMARAKTRDYEQAVADLSRFIVAQPRNANAYVCRGSALTSLGQYDNAIKDYNAAANLDHTNSEASYYRSWTQDLQYDEMMEREENQVDMARDKGHGPGLAVSGADAEGKKGAHGPDQEDAQSKVDLLDKRIAGSPKDAALYCDRAWLLLNLGKPKPAIADYDAAINLNGSLAVAFNNRGLAYFKLGQYDKAIRDYSQNIVMDGQNASAFFRRAVAFDRLAKYDLAAADYQKASILNPPRAKTYAAAARADLNRISGQHARSIASADATTATQAAASKIEAGAVSSHKDPDTRAATDSASKSAATDKDLYGRHLVNGWDFIGQRNYKNALREFDLACGFSAPGKALFHGRALAYSNLGDHSRALDNINRAIAMAPSDKHLYEVRERINRSSSSLNDMQTNVPIAPQTAGNTSATANAYVAHFCKGEEFFKNSQPARALQEYNAALASNPPDWARAGIYSERARVYFKFLHDNDQALADINESIRLEKNSGGPYLVRGNIYRALGRPGLAAMDYQKDKHSQAAQNNMVDDNRHKILSLGNWIAGGQLFAGLVRRDKKPPEKYCSSCPEDRVCHSCGKNDLWHRRSSRRRIVPWYRARLAYRLPASSPVRTLSRSSPMHCIQRDSRS